MKKLLLIVVALCCMISVSAQEQKHQLSLKEKVKKVEQINRQNQAFTQKLDSIVNDDNTKIIFTYDHLYRRIGMKMVYGYGMVMIDQQYFYDAQGHLSYITSDGPFPTEKIEYSYNSQGLVSEAIEYELDGDDWALDYKTNYEYDSHGNMLTAVEKEYEAGEWINFMKMEYSYSAGKLTKILESTWDSDDGFWSEYCMDEYSYNGAGYCNQLLESYYYGYWDEREKTIYEYDNDYNCVKETTYRLFGTPDWELESVIEYTYDPTVPGSSIAGYDDIFENMTIEVKSKLLKVEESYYDDGELDEHVISILYYSKGAQVPELPLETLTIGPNPATTFLSIQAKDLRQVEIFSMDGKMVMRLENGFESVKVSEMAAGTYLLKATMKDGNVITQKFMKN